MNAFRAIAGWVGGFFDKRLWSPLHVGRATTSRQNISEESALNYSAVWCATRVMCGTGASLPLPLYRGLEDGNRERQRKHPIDRLLNGSPNPEMPAYQFRSLMWQWQINWGNAYAEIVREGNNPEGEIEALWPIHPARVEVKRDENWELFYEVRDEESNTKYPVEPWQMLHIPSIITCDGIIGKGVIEHARESIGAGIAAEKYGAHWFGGAAVPRVAVEHPGNWNEESRKAFRDDWGELYGGADGERVALVMGGAKIVPLSLSAEDSQFLETRQFGVEEIARWYGIPPHMLQHLLRATFNNIEEMGIGFVEYSLIPWLRIWEQVISHKLMDADEREEYYAEHNVDALLRGNASQRADFYVKMRSNGLMNANEIRRKENLPPVPGGDVFLVQGAMVPLDEDGKPQSEFAQPGASAAEPMDDASEPVEALLAKLYRILERDLNWLLTKEGKAAVTHAKKGGQFITTVDDFYAAHSVKVRDVVTDTLGAMAACGVIVSPDTVVSAWVDEGKSHIMEAAGRARPDDLLSAVQAVVDSTTWTQRPLRAVESLKGGGDGAGV